MRAGAYQRGTVLFAEINFSGSIGMKNRPVVVLSVNTFHQAGSKIIVAGLTSNVSPPLRPGDTLIVDWAGAGLVKPSAMRGLMTTIDQNEVVRRLGRLSPEDFAHVEQAVADIMGLAIPSRN